jgi:hypothetical protein
VRRAGSSIFELKEVCTVREITSLGHQGDDRTFQGGGTMALRRGFTEAQAQAVALEIGLDFEASEFDIEAFRRGMDVELEHGRRDPETNVTDDDPETTGRIAWAHLKELPDYYERLEAVEHLARPGGFGGR